MHEKGKKNISIIECTVRDNMEPYLVNAYIINEFYNVIICK